MSQATATQLRRFRFAIALAVATPLSEHVARAQTVRCGVDVTWCIDVRGDVRSVENREPSGASELSGVGLRFSTATGRDAAQRPRFRRGATPLILEHVDAGALWQWLSLPSATGYGDVLMARAVGRGRAVTFEGASIQNASSAFVASRTVERAGARRYLVARFVGFARTGHKLVIDSDEAFVYLTISHSLDDARRRLRLVQHRGLGWFDLASTYDALLGARIKRVTRSDDPLANAYEIAVRQLHDRLSPDGRSIFDFEADGTSRAVPPHVTRDAADALVNAGLEREGHALLAALEASGDPTRDPERTEVDALAWGRASPVLPLSNVMRAPPSASVATELGALLQRVRIPMLVEPLDDRPAAPLLVVGGQDGMDVATDHVGNVCANQARSIRELLRIDGTLGWCGRLRPGAKPGPMLECNPLATAWLADARITAGDVRGGRRALEAIENARIRCGGLGFGWHFDDDVADPRPEHVWAAAAVAGAIQRLCRAEQQTVATMARCDEIPDLLHRFANEEPRYRWAFERAYAWRKTLGKGLRPRDVVVRSWAKKLEGDELDEEIRALLATSAKIEAEFESSLSR
ncbi:MAG: hypothetical protein H6832_13125 [Planctomycetes bacterium]|nr:hypothetical protein [Planctomycetota bacterium]